MIPARICLSFAVTAAAFFLHLGAAHAVDPDVIYGRIEQLHGDPLGFTDTLAFIQSAASARDVHMLSSYGEYPLTVNANGETYDIQSSEDFVENFDSIVTQDTLNTLANAEVGDMLVNGDGVAIGDGAVWLAAVCENADCSATHWAITAINN